MYILPVILLGVLILTDQLTKYLAVTRLMPAGNIDIIDNFFSLTYVENKGAAFGFLQGAKWLFVILTIAVCVLCVIYYVRLKKENKDRLIRISLIFVCSGAIGNLIDRVFRGYVVDMLNFCIFGFDYPVFNFADICVCIGAFLLVMGTLLSGREGK